MVKEILFRSFNILLCILLAVVLGASMFVTPNTNARIEHSANLADLPVSQADTWSEHVWGGPNNNIFGSYVWIDGTNYYYSEGTIQLVLDTSTNTWSAKTWSGLSSFSGSNIWTDGTNYYYSRSRSHFVLDTSTSTWSSKTWTGLSDFDGSYVWTDGTNYYYSSGSSQYVLDTQTSTWSAKTWSGLSSFDGSYVWTDGTNYYYSYASSQYVLDTQTSTWSKKSWSGLSSFSGSNIWTDGTNYYYSSGSSQYVLDISTSKWSTKTWTLPDNSIGLFGSRIFTVGNIAYYCNYVNDTNYQWYYNFSSATPSTVTLPRLNFEYPQNKSVHSNYFSSDSYLGYVSLQPLIQNDTLSFTTDSFLDFGSSTAGRRYREFVSIDFVVGQSTVSSIALSSLSTVTDLQFSHYRGDYNISTFTVGSYSGTQLISFASTLNNVTNFQPANLNIGVTDLPTTTYPYGARRNNIMYSDSNGNMVVMYIYYISSSDSSNFIVSNLCMPESSYTLVDTGSGGYSSGYSAGYDAGHTAGESSGYNNGYNVGYSSGDSAGYNRGYSAGDSAGYTRGYGVGEKTGYNTGYTAGTKDANKYTFLALVSATIDAPIQAFMGLFNFDVFGIHVSDFILGLITLSIALIILRIALKGGK